MDRPTTKRVSPLVAGRPEVERIYSMTINRDIETVKKVILQRYGFEVTDAYAADLITFVEALTDGQ